MMILAWINTTEMIEDQVCRKAGHAA